MQESHFHNHTYPHVLIITELLAGRNIGVRFPIGVQISFFSSVFRSALVPTQPHNQRTPRVKRQELEPVSSNNSTLCHNPQFRNPLLRLLVAGFPQCTPRFYPISGHVGFVVEKLALGQVPTPPSAANYQSTNWPIFVNCHITRRYLLWITGFFNFVHRPVF
jgi:hypothetical protein